MNTVAVDFTKAREDFSRLVDDVYLSSGKAYVVYKRKIPLAMLVKYEAEVEPKLEKRKVDRALFGIWKGRPEKTVSGIRSLAWKKLNVN